MMKINHKDVIKYRTHNTALAMIDIAKDVNENELIESLCILTEDAFFSNLIRDFEKQILLAKLRPDDFKKGLHQFYKEKAKYIKKNSLYKSFFSFVGFVHKECKSKEELIMSMYFNLVAQQYVYLGDEKNHIVGVETNGKVIKRKELLPYLDYPIFMIEKLKAKDSISTLLKRFNYNISSVEEYLTLVKMEQFTTNNRITISQFITEKTVDLLPEKMSPLVARGIDIPYFDFKTERVKELIEETRRFFLPQKGTKVLVQNIGQIKEIFFKEIYKGDVVSHLLYKITFVDEGETSGFYELKDRHFWCIWNESNAYTLTMQVEQVILYLYLNLITENSLIDVGTDHLSFYSNFTNNKKPQAVIVSSDNNKLNKESYLKEIIRINPHIRQLPEGHEPSQEAKNLAKQYGLLLKEGETFVRPFNKPVYKNKPQS